MIPKMHGPGLLYKYNGDWQLSVRFPLVSSFYCCLMLNASYSGMTIRKIPGWNALKIERNYLLPKRNNPGILQYESGARLHIDYCTSSDKDILDGDTVKIEYKNGQLLAGKGYLLIGLFTHTF